MCVDRDNWNIGGRYFILVLVIKYSYQFYYFLFYYLNNNSNCFVRLVLWTALLNLTAHGPRPLSGVSLEEEANKTKTSSPSRPYLHLCFLTFVHYTLFY